MSDLISKKVEDGVVAGEKPDNPNEYTVLVEEHHLWGCPFCGYRSGYSPISSGGTAVWRCGQCQRSCFLLDHQNSELRVVGMPPLTKHPRNGIPSHGAADVRPPGGGEFFVSPGINLDVADLVADDMKFLGSNNVPLCFVCGEQLVVSLNSIAAFVQCQAAGGRVVTMFGQHAWLLYRDFEPDRVQIEVGACDLHLPNLQRLHALTSGLNGVITDDVIANSVTMGGSLL